MRIVSLSLIASFALGLFSTHPQLLAEEKVASSDKNISAKEIAEDEEYYELLKLFADTVDQIDRNYVKDVDKRELMEAAIEGMIGKLDQYSNYIPPTDLEKFRTGVDNEFGGIGIQVSMENEEVIIISPMYKHTRLSCWIAGG